MPVLQPDTAIRLPSVMVLKASAGSGKTRTLTERYVQFLLSRSIPRNGLPNMLAITFSNNASREMKDNILLWLKALALRDPERMEEICLITSGGEEQVSRGASAKIEEILQSYSDFQVRTIDSFMSTVFRASAVELGFSPELEIVLDPAPLVQYAFDLFLRQARDGSPAARLLDATVASLVAQRGEADGFPWAPAAALRAQLTDMEKRLASLESDPLIDDQEARIRSLQRRIRDALEETGRLAGGSGLAASRRSSLSSLLASARAGRFMDIAGRGLGSIPVKRPSKKDPLLQEAYEKVLEAWESTRALVGDYAAAVARGFYAPGLRLHAELASSVERAKRSRGTIFLGDINRKLRSFLSRDIVPDVYFRMGERIFHYLIDEFQDTSPIQWQNLFPLIENSLAQGGSLFLVGDTKQAIYGFRQADYTIMKRLEKESPFPSAAHAVADMDVNYRSRREILETGRHVFMTNASALPAYREAASRSGLDAWEQRPADASASGLVNVVILPRDDESPPERGRLHDLLEQLHGRGWRWGDIAILASRNEEVIRAASWLNEKRIPFLSFSSLDVRRRKPAGEVLSLLAFLDSPKDDLSFVTFVLGDIFRAAMDAAARGGFSAIPSAARLHRFLLEHADRRPLYKAFQEEFPGTWDRFFTGLFRSAGYLPLYDLASEVYTAFKVFERKPDEEATLARLLEAIKDFEGSGSNSLRDFLRFAAETDAGGAWDVDVPESADSVRVMTIHKAKGLGFPVAILLLYGERTRGPGAAVLRENGGLRLVRLARSLSRHDPGLEELYEEEVTRARVNQLNGLYVALTRAKEEMHIIGVKRDRDAFPFDLLPEPVLAREGPAGAGAAGPVAADLEAAGPGPGRAAAPLPAALSHDARPVPPAFGSRRLNLAERRRGVLAHAALSRIRFAGPGLEPEIRAAAARAARELRLDAPDPVLAASAARLISRGPLAELFAPKDQRQVFTEWELCRGDGRLFRMDRVVLDPDRAAVIDWKTGADEEGAERHAEQVGGYADILEELYPDRRIEAFLAYLDRGEVVRVR